jgi:hypothetical protein
MLKLMLKMVLAVIILVPLVPFANAQSFIGGGLVVKRGEFGLYDVPNSTLDSAIAIGGFGEGARDWQAGKTILAVRVLASVERNFSRNSSDFTQYDVRPEAELRLPLPYGFQPLVAAGVNYMKVHNGPYNMNPILGGGLQYRDFRGSVYRFFKDNENGNARGILYRADYMKKPFRISAELFNGRSELDPFQNPYHPGYEGYTFTARFGLVK